jgi:uncharacterized repeat protein (TIGR03803 family)/YVTN family beta-propeller protein
MTFQHISVWWLRVCLTFAFTFLLLILLAVPAQSQAVIATVPVRPDPGSLAVDLVTNKIYVSCPVGQCTAGTTPTTVIDGATNSTTNVTDPNAIFPQGVAVNPATNKIYVANAISNNVMVIDGATNSTTTVTDPNAIGPGVVAVNPMTDRIYVGNGGSNTVTVIDGATNVITTVANPIVCPYLAAYDIAVNPVTNKIYATNLCAANMGFPSFVSVIDGATNSVTVVSDYLPPLSVAINSLTNKIYVANAENSHLRSNGNVMVIDGITNSTTFVTDPKAITPEAVAVDPVTNKIYVANLVSNNVTVIDGATNATTTVIDPNAKGSRAVAVNPVTNRIYVVNGDSNNVTVIAGAGGCKNKVLYRFRGGADGASPVSSLILDKAGNLYGTTSSGGVSSSTCPGGCGTIFKLTHQPDGSWTKSVLHRFVDTDGATPLGGLIFDAAGNLYGTASAGGSCSHCGVVFKLTPNADGTWTEHVLHRFTGGSDGGQPVASLMLDLAGNVYGTTGYGGAYAYGVVFKLTPSSNGTWTESVLHAFDLADGSNPLAGLTFDVAGNLFGTTITGSGSGCPGSSSCGTAFQLTPHSNGMWTESVLHEFELTDGSYPLAGLIFDAAGTLYGTTRYGGAFGDGLVFKLTPNSKGGWTEQVLHQFTGKDGAHPYAGLVFDGAGNLYGTTQAGGPEGYGSVFKLTPTSTGGWREKVLWSFLDQPGAHPQGGLIFDKAGNLYGTTTGDGANTFGSVFEITP